MTFIEGILPQNRREDYVFSSKRHGKLGLNHDEIQ